MNKFMRTRILLLAIFFSFSYIATFSQSSNANDNKNDVNNNKNKKHFIGSSFFIIANLFPDSPHFYQLNYGYRITEKDVISVEAIAWDYSAPVGIAYGSDMGDEKNNFPGKVKAYGIGLVYKRFLWKKMYVAIHSQAMHQDYLDKDNKKIQSGFQLFNTLRFGYQFKFFNNRFFLEPSIAFTYWPVNTNLPKSFQIQEDKWNNYFLFEPGLHFGFNF